MAKFMTAATLRNMPAYLADARARRAGESADKEKQRQQDMQKRMQKLGQTFMASGDFTPEGLQKFAQDNEMSMPEMQGMVTMVTNFKKLNQQKAAPRVPNVWAQEGGKRVRRPDVAGLESEMTLSGQGGGDKVPDWMRFGRDTLKSSLGFTQQTGWADEASQQKFDTVLADYDKRMQGKDASQSIAELHGAVTAYDQEKDVVDTVKAIPKNSTFTTVNDAKTQVDSAISAGAVPADIEEDLKAKGWDDRQITRIMGKTSSTTNPLGL